MSATWRAGVLALAALVTAASCGDDPGRPCLAGMVRLPGPACTLPPIVDIYVDGTRTDWASSQSLQVLIPGSCCSSGDGGITYAGRQADGQLTFFSNTLGTPITDGSMVYGLAFRRADLADGALGNVQTLFLVRSDFSVEAYVNGERVFGVPASAAIGFQGVEWRLPAAALPYAGAAYVVGVTYEREGDEFKIHDAATGAALVCWDPGDAAGDLCTQP
jgi:hypothetical protein